ncbi:flagellar hook-length control protein FliK [Vibrio crassostreae]|uniref:flagellar hook-length control protein FliK n=1 Tax=Vibrio crassostreae TaxID=246167 RepID=UPI00104CC153|nr:flagellar hook-length control protein FliK [Vibrio crassostreae]TCO00939.1 flagellar hook-length control protein FliK [Vibrio crassostreae]CAK1721097.1 flagellar hook-length control protein FliK [Vibrio crassostreae]CAK2189382.1 flagellar hook-length control protein FliK [Vibrio crassostreae]CAK2191287.1 flagellar hook-length control protein FliK [Vibrio crassostreae]CAK2527298.1 flagellar hook-length control protein FliK [Vibrio crassostreae]
MNVSPSSNSATNKTSSLLETGSAASKVEETGDSKGFFESFKEALGFEESDSKVAVKDAESASKSEDKQTSAEGDASSEKTNSESAGKTQGDVAESKSTDATSEAQANQAGTTVGAEKASVEDAKTNKSGAEQTAELDSQSKDKTSSNMAGDDTPAEKAQSEGEQLQAASAGHHSKDQTAELQAKDASQANAAMSEGNKLLGQLDEANKTLNKTPNGKGLPQQAQIDQAQGNIAGAPIAGASVAGLATQQNNTANSDSAFEVDTEIAVLTGGKGVSQLTDDEIRQLMDKGVTPEQIEASMNRELSQKNAASAVAADQSQALSPAELELAKQVDAHTKALNQLNAQIESEQSVVDGLLQKQQSGAKLTVDEQAALAKVTSNIEVLNQQLANVQQQATALLSQAPNATGTSGNPTAIDWDNSDSNEAKALAAVASTAAVATAAQQATSQASSQAAANAVSDKTAMLHANNAHAAQQANLASPQQQAALDPALTAQGMAMNTAPTATKAGSTDMLLKAGAGAAALAGLGKAGAKEDSKDSTFAQQIASAAGVQGAATASSAPTRAEIQAAQQAPLQLTKELANEQVAEKVQMMMSKNLKNLDIRLDPPELGQMKIRMTMNNDVASVHFTVNSQQARDVIEQTLPRLREMLAQQGMQLADSSVQQQNSGQGQDRYNNGEQQSGSNRTNDAQGDENLDSGSNLELNVASKRDGISYYA